MSNATFTSTKSVVGLLIVLLAVVLLAPLLLFGFGMGTMGGWHMGPWMMGSGDGWTHGGWMMGSGDGWTHGGWMMGSGDGWMAGSGTAGVPWFGWLAFALMLLVPLALVLLLGYVAYRLLASASSDRDPALDELRAAYARGDLSDEEFERRREQLRRTG